MAQTVLITGSSTGIGKATAKWFQDKGWNVIATMRSPQKEAELTQLDNVLVTRLDVTDSESIQRAIAAGLDRFGSIDALVNNAGYGACGPLEAFPMESIRRQFDTNVIGLLDVTKAVLPHFRAQKSGILVNISSIVGKVAFPLGTLYHGTKFAVEGISESLSYELASAGIKMKIVEPGAIATEFAGRSFDFTNDESMVEYQDIVKNFMGGFEGIVSHAAPVGLVAETIWNAVTDGTNTLRYLVGQDAESWDANRKAMDDAAFIDSIKSQFGMT
ncbi:MAG: SDR family oxidoreductase [Cyanobacteria bacterium P01_F01_bin.153]